MEKNDLITQESNILSSCKYFATSALFVLLYSCNNPDFSESKWINKSPFIFLISDSLGLSSWITCDANDVCSIANKYIKEWRFNEATEILLSAKDSLLRSQNNINDPYLWTIYDNLWYLYNCTQEREKSIDYYKKSIDIARKDWNVRNLIFRLNNLSTTYLNLQDYNQSISLLKEAYSLLQKNSEILWDDYVVYLIYTNLASIYIWNWDFVQAKPYFLKAKDIVEKDSSFGSYEKSSILTWEADFLIADKKYKEAFLTYEKALFLCEWSDDIDWQHWILWEMIKLLLSLGDYKTAYFYQEKRNIVNDTINSHDKVKIRLDYEVDYKTEEIQLEKERKEVELKVREAELEIQKQKTKNAIIVLLLSGLSTIISAWAGYFINKKKKEVEEKNIIIIEQKQEVEMAMEEIKTINEALDQKNDQLQKTNDNLAKANVVIEEKNAEIVKSIEYSKYLQNDLIGTDDDVLLKQYFSDSFLIHKQRDIVGWDFYYVGESKNWCKVLAVVDCTGHGVPWAMWTMLLFPHIETVVKESTSPSEILNSLNMFLKNISSHKKSSQYMSADIAIWFLDEKTNIFYYSGSWRPLLIVRDWKLIEWKGSWSYLGDENHKKDFKWYTTEIFQLETWDTIYLTSDWYHSQFKNWNWNTFKSRNLKAELIKLQWLPMEEQLQTLSEKFEKFRGWGEQTDDVTVVWIKIGEKKWE